MQNLPFLSSAALAKAIASFVQPSEQRWKRLKAGRLPCGLLNPTDDKSTARLSSSSISIINSRQEPSRYSSLFTLHSPRLFSYPS
jgi:hypothetical protein